ncbi:MAG: DEAD/DEAH box helicase [Woeseia sp.]|jgi:ATP-dependent RNA helicase DeaD|nr:DEAD/DEAH box helicase [Woeseia sp.]
MSKSDAKAGTTSFRDLNLSEPLVKVLNDIGYETPTPIQSQAIPHLLAGRDILGHAPTGTGKTAAFALPLLSGIDVKSNKIQVLTLTPTRELAIQVAEAFQHYASYIKDFHVLPVYGGQEYGGQIRQLKRGVQVVVGTPGRLKDHIRKGTLKLDGLRALVLDEADEMLRMGFIEEVEWILEQTPDKRQMALFSATMPKQVERIARRYLNDPQEISIKSKTATAETIRQRYWQVSGVHKLDALTRILEVETFDAILMFVRTKVATTELAEKLEARGYAAAAMNGDMAQNHREKTVERLKNGSLDILVATDVAARGLDVQRISHVINYDVPYDIEAYIHRIGRTGRAGRSGDAILFVAPRERRMLAAIEKATRQKIEQLVLPTTETVNNKRIADFKQKITDTLAVGELAFMQGLIEQYRQEHDVPAVEIAAALAKMSTGGKSMLLSADKFKDKGKGKSKDNGHEKNSNKAQRKPHRETGEGQERFRIEVGHVHGVKPGNIVGAIANESGLDGEHIGSIEIDSEFSLIDLPVGMPDDVLIDLKKTRICGQLMNISRHGEAQPGKRKSKPNSKGRSEGKSKPRGHSDSKPSPKARAEGKSKPKGYSDSKPSPKVRAEGKSKPKRYSDSKPSPKARAEGKSKPKAHSKDKPSPKGRSEGKPSPKARLKGKLKIKSTVNTKVRGKPKSSSRGAK